MTCILLIFEMTLSHWGSLQDMLEAWGVPFSEHFEGRPGLSICELSLVESVVRCAARAEHAAPSPACCAVRTVCVQCIVCVVASCRQGAPPHVVNFAGAAPQLMRPLACPALCLQSHPPTPLAPPRLPQPPALLPGHAGLALQAGHPSGGQPGAGQVPPAGLLPVLLWGHRAAARGAVHD